MGRGIWMRYCPGETSEWSFPMRRTPVTFKESDQRTLPEPTLAASVAIRHWSNLAQLVRFAADRHGFGDSDGGFGITYPTDLDEHDREVEKMVIPDGYVLAYGFWGIGNGGYEVLVPERLYLNTLAEVLAAASLGHEAALVRSLAAGRDVG